MTGSLPGWTIRPPQLKVNVSAGVALNNLKFRSFWQAGFECATQINRDGKRLDVVQATQHDRWAATDYRRLASEGILTAREGVRWHVIESRPGEFDFESVELLLEAAHSAGIELIWDLLHFGWPAWLDIFSSEWLDAFERFVTRFLECLQRWPGTLFVNPVNEISFLSWAAGEVGYLYPFGLGRGDEVKDQLVRAFHRAAGLIRTLRPGSVIVTSDPVIHIASASAEPAAAEDATRRENAMFQGWDMLTGKLRPELGGWQNGFDVLGVNFYPQNQWLDNGSTLQRGEPGYRGLREFLHQVYERYERPLVITETGAEDEDRAEWLEYVAAEVAAAIRDGVPVLGVCWYPILDHPGWDDDRYCRHGFWSYPSETGERAIHQPLADVLRRQPHTIMTTIPQVNITQPVSQPISQPRNPGETLLCFSHLRWNFVFQRPQHLMRRFAQAGRVLFIEEPLCDASSDNLEIRPCPLSGVTIVTPHLYPGHRAVESATAALLHAYLRSAAGAAPVVWFYTPMALALLPDELKPAAIIYDCMDELSGFLGAPAELQSRERNLMDRADLIFTGGRSLFEEKKRLRSNVYAFPSGVDVAHFQEARRVQTEAGDALPEPEEYGNIGGPRFGYAGVIDERIDLDLIAGVAEARPEWQFIMIGPVVKIDPNSLPRRQNIHWLGMRPYASLPSYMRGWDAGIMPFALNEATRFISPTKTPEYLAAGLRVLSTAVQDVVRPYGEKGFVEIVQNVAEFIEGAQQILDSPLPAAKRAEIDFFLLSQSWDSIWNRMNALIQETIDGKRPSVPQMEHAFAGGQQYV